METVAPASTPTSALADCDDVVAGVRDALGTAVVDAVGSDSVAVSATTPSVAVEPSCVSGSNGAVVVATLVAGGLVCADPVATVGVGVSDTPPATASSTIEKTGVCGTALACVDSAAAVVSVVTPGVAGDVVASISGLSAVVVAPVTGCVVAVVAPVWTAVACSRTPALAVGSDTAAVVGEPAAVLVATDWAGVWAETASVGDADTALCVVVVGVVGVDVASVVVEAGAAVGVDVGWVSPDVAVVVVAVASTTDSSVKSKSRVSVDGAVYAPSTSKAISSTGGLS